MKIIYLVVQSVFFPFLLCAQFTITSDYQPNIGDDVVYLQKSNPEVNVYNYGENQTWDLSSLEDTTQSFSRIFIDTASAEHSAIFPSSNIVHHLGDGAESFYSNSDSAFLHYGYHYTQQKLILEDPFKLLSFPMSYGDSFSDPYSGIKTTTNYEHLIVGNVEVTIDGYGELILPYGTVDDVVRVKKEVTHHEISMADGDTISTLMHTDFIWYKEGFNHYIAHFREIHDVFSSTSAFYISEIYLDIEDGDVKRSPVSFYPNPVTEGQLIIEKVNSTPLELLILNLNGEELKRFTVENHSNTIDVSDLQSGIYFIRYVDQKIAYTEKLVVR